MGRTKHRIEVISNKNFLHKTFEKRMKGLKKKAYELKTLCGVEVCMIVFGPKMDGCTDELEIWPSNPDEILTLIDSYKKQSMEDRMKRSSDLSDYFKDQNKAAEDALAKLPKNHEATYPTWDERYNACTEEELREFSALLEYKIQDVKYKVEFIKGTPRLPAPSTIIDSSQMQSIPNHSYSMQGLFERSIMQPEVLYEQTAQMNSHYVDMTIPYPSQQTYPGLDLGANSTVNSTLMMLMRDNNCAHMMGGTSRSNFLYNPPINPTYYYDSHVSGVMDNMVANNPQPHLAHYASNMQSVLPYMQYRMMENSISSQLEASQMDKYCEINEFHRKNQN